jgi:hypothetical protein
MNPITAGYHAGDITDEQHAPTLSLADSEWLAVS